MAAVVAVGTVLLPVVAVEGVPGKLVMGMVQAQVLPDKVMPAVTIMHIQVQLVRVAVAAAPAQQAVMPLIIILEEMAV